MKNHILGLPHRPSSPAQEFGTRFHDFLLLDTETIPNGKGATATRRMLDALRNDPLFSRLLRLGQPEQVQFWEDERTGLPCKARIDLPVPNERIIVDVKTTSALNVDIMKPLKDKKTDGYQLQS